jgi:hypothetical protein
MTNSMPAMFARLLSAKTRRQTTPNDSSWSAWRRRLLIKLEAIIQGEFTSDFIGQVECAVAGQQRAA